jgi:hypothetical protein
MNAVELDKQWLEHQINPPLAMVEPTKKQKRMLYMRKYRSRNAGTLPESPTDMRPGKIHEVFTVCRTVYEPT